MTGDRCQRWSLRCTFVCTVQRCVGIALRRRMRETSIGLLRALRESRSKVYERVPGDDAERVGVKSRVTNLAAIFAALRCENSDQWHI